MSAEQSPVPGPATDHPHAAELEAERSGWYELANLVRSLVAGGAEVYVCASNPLSTQDDTAAALCEEDGVSVFAIKGEDNETYYRHLNAVLDRQPQVTMVHRVRLRNRPTS